MARIYSVGQRLDFSHEVYRLSKFQLHFAFRTFFPSYGLCVYNKGNGKCGLRKFLDGKLGRVVKVENFNVETQTGA